MKNYYKVLGILDDAEDIVIRAAYRALAQRYHPDKIAGDEEGLSSKMVEINEAYSILSDPAKRKKYDEENLKYRKRSESSSEGVDERFLFSRLDDETWELAVKSYPLIEVEFLELKRINTILANTYKTNLIASKKFQYSTEIKIKYEKAYFNKYYGKNLAVHLFVKKLLIDNKKNAADKVNKIYQLMGDSFEYKHLPKLMSDKFPEVNFFQKNAFNNKFSIHEMSCDNCGYFGRALIGSYYSKKYSIIKSLPYVLTPSIILLLLYGKYIEGLIICGAMFLFFYIDSRDKLECPLCENKIKNF